MRSTLILSIFAAAGAAAPAIPQRCRAQVGALPSAASQGLPAPTGTFVGSFSASGTQNYDCSGKGANDAPDAIGADAYLRGTCGFGIHSFENPTTPVFDMANLGLTKAQRAAAMASPAGSQNIPWLRLDATSSTEGIKDIYRVNTSGGVAPATCGARAGTVIRVSYTANYYFYA